MRPVLGPASARELTLAFPADRRMLPPPDHRRAPWIASGIAVICLAVHVAQVLGWSETAQIARTDAQLCLVQFGAKSAALIGDANESWRLLTTHLVHTGWLHLAFNLAFFVPVAGALEAVLRRSDFVVLLLLAGLTSSATSLIWTPEISAGLSGLVFAVLGAAVFVGLRHGRALPRSLRLHFGWPVLPFLSLLLLAGLGNAQIDHASHFGGLAAGCLIGPWTRLRGDDSSPRWRTLVPSMAAAMAILLAAPAVARGGSGPRRYRYDDLAVLETPAGWTADFGPFGEVRFSGATNLVSASIRRVPTRATAHPAEWYVREQLSALLDSGEITDVVDHGPPPCSAASTPHRFTYQRQGRHFAADVAFVAMPQGILAVTFESPVQWSEKYGETRVALLGSIGPVTTPARDDAWGYASARAANTACCAVCSESSSPPRP